MKKKKYFPPSPPFPPEWTRGGLAPPVWCSNNQLSHPIDQRSTTPPTRSGGKLFWTTATPKCWNINHWGNGGNFSSQLSGFGFKKKNLKNIF